jgi:lysophospholipase L1-like esterase|uniref:SGNH/GDSL hydrolase family protein n=1 Tax=Desulfobacca acetoxidans TaxID=60893 RepID=A0A7V6A447_9BACT
MPQPRSRGKNVLFTIITMFIGLVTVELGLHAINWVAMKVSPNPERIPWRGLYQGKSWAPALARESDGRAQDYHQYLTWISKPQKGHFVNIDPDTGRKTWNPANLKPPVSTVFLFGGSACWGYGARDDYTIPSQLSCRLNSQEPHYRVYNYAEPGYTFTQGLFYLITKLRDGARPSLVIFYDGFNDVYGSYQSGEPGAQHNLAQIREKLTSKPRQLYWQAVKDWWEEHIFLYSKVLCRFFQPPQQRFREVGAGFTDQQLQALAVKTVQYYSRSLALLDHLSQAYGFKYVCFWQPALFTETRVLPQEKRLDARQEDENFARLYQFTNRYLAQHPPGHYYYNLTDAVSGRTQPCYVDLVHMTEKGYGIVADRMEQVLKQKFSLGE